MQRYDFAKQSPADPARADAHDSLHADFAATFSSALRQILLTDPRITHAQTEQFAYGDFLASRANPTCLSVLRVEPMGAQICLDLSPALAFPMIDRLLGGRGDVAAIRPTRALTQIEQGLALQIIERAAAALADTWNRCGIEAVREDGLFSDPGRVRIMPADEMVSVVTFDVTFKNFSGAMTLCLPAVVSDCLVGSVYSTEPTDLSTDKRDRDRQNLTDNVMQSAVELRALLAETKLRLDEVIALQEGDIITTDRPADALIPLRMQGQDMLHGRLAELDGKLAVEIANSAGGQPEK